jgi:hypothetical protein
MGSSKPKDVNPGLADEVTGEAASAQVQESEPPTPAAPPPPPVASKPTHVDLPSDPNRPPPPPVLAPVDPFAPRDIPPMTRPSEAQMAILAHCTLDGIKRTESLNALEAKYGPAVILEQIRKMKGAGVIDGGQVLTPYGRDILERFGA